MLNKKTSRTRNSHLRWLILVGLVGLSSDVGLLGWPTRASGLSVAANVASDVATHRAGTTTGTGPATDAGAQASSETGAQPNVATRKHAVLVARVRPVRLTDAAHIEKRLLQSATYLASDELEGRGVGTDGLDSAAEYLAKRFKDDGLKTNLYNGTPFHEFSRSTRLGLGSTNQAVLHGPDNRKLDLRVAYDFTPLSLSSSGTFDLPMVFSGYGITAKEWGYDDYAGIDVTGKAVVMFRHEPEQANPESVFNGTEISDHAYFAQKVTNAVEHGAAAVILVTDLYNLRQQAADEQTEHNNGTNSNNPTASSHDRLLNFRVRAKLGDRRIPVMHCRREKIDRLVQAVLGTDLAALEQQIDKGLKPHSRELTGWRITGEVSVLNKGRSLKNVVGVLEGHGDLAEETIIIGAHYDHLGRGGWGSMALGVDDEIHNGADDNASGTAVLLEVATLLATRKEKLPRRIVFIAFTAEEQGLVGSAQYVRDPLVPLKQTVAMLNLDMVGRLRNEKLTVFGTGTALEFNSLVDRLTEKHEFRAAKRSGGYGPSDHASFFTHGIPVLHFFTGFHPDYHRPSDDVHKLNIRGMRRLVNMVAEMVIELAQAEQRPQRGTADSPLAGLLGSPSWGTGGSKTKSTTAYLGVALDRDSSETGFPIDRTFERSPAQRAGCRAGDVIIRLDDQKIAQADDLIAALKQHKPGNQVTVVVRRGVTELEFKVTLGALP